MNTNKKLTLKEYHAQCLTKREAMKHEKPPDKNEIIENFKNTDILIIKQDPIKYLSNIHLNYSNSISMINNEFVVNNKDAFLKSLSDLRFFILASNILFN